MLGEPLSAVEDAAGPAEQLTAIGDRHTHAALRINLAIAYAATGRRDEARASVERALELTPHRATHLFVEATTALAMALPAEDGREAALLLGAVAPARTRWPVPPEVAHYLDPVLERLRQRDDFEQLWLAGSGLSLDEAMERALAL